MLKILGNVWDCDSDLCAQNVRVLGLGMAKKLKKLAKVLEFKVKSKKGKKCFAVVQTTFEAKMATARAPRNAYCHSSKPKRSKFP